MTTDISVAILPAATAAVVLNGTRTFTITATNSVLAGAKVASNVQVVLGRPASVTGSPTSISPGTSFSGNIWTIGTLTVGQSVSLTIPLTYTATGTVGIFVAISGLPDDTTTNNFLTVYTSVNTPVGNASAVIAYTPSNLTLTAGSRSTFVITYQKTGSAATNVHIYFPLPTGVNLISATPSVGSVSGTDWNISTVAAADHTIKTLTLVLEFPQSGVFTLGDAVLSTQRDVTLANDSAHSIVTVNTTVNISDVNMCCNPISPGSQFQICFEVTSSDALSRQKDIYIYLSDVFKTSDHFLDENRHCYCLTAPTTTGDYAVKIQAVDDMIPSISDVKIQTLYVRTPTCPSYLSGCTGLSFTPVASGAITISANLSDALDRIFVQHQLLSCRNSCSLSLVLNTQSDFHNLIGFIDRSDFAVGSAAYQLQQLISSNKPTCC